MSRIEIDADGRKIVIEHDGELEPLRRAALGLWSDTQKPERLGPATGFQQTQVRPTRPVSPSGNGAYSQPPAPVNAEHDVP
jgi:hypothetical protein